MTEDLELSYYSSQIKLPAGYTPQPEILEHVEVIKEHSRIWVAVLTKQGVEYIKAG